QAYGDHRSRLHERSRPGKEGLVSQMCVVLVQQLVAKSLQLHSDYLEPLVFKTAYDSTDESSLDRVRLYQHQCPLHLLSPCMKIELQTIANAASALQAPASAC